MGESLIENLNKHDFENKNVIVTGATGVIGQEIVRHLLKLGANVFLAVRNTKKANDFLVKLNEDEKPKVKIFQLDVASLDSIDEFVEKVKDEKINYLINNAGVYNLKPGFSPDGFEIHFATNFLGPIYLTLKLLPILNQNENSKVVFQGSFSYVFYKIDWKNVESLDVKNGLKVYARTKRLLILTAYSLKQKLQKNYKNVSFVFAHPGLVSTDILLQKNSRFSKGFAIFSKKVLKLVCHSAKTGAMPCVMALSNSAKPNSNIVPRGLFHVWGKPKISKIYWKVIEKQEIEKAQENLNLYLQKIKKITGKNCKF